MISSDLFEIKGKKLIRFKGDDSITEVSIPDGITTVMMQAFFDKNALKHIYFPDGVTTIEGDPLVDARTKTLLFDGCRNTLETIRIPDSMETIPDPVLSDVPNLSFNEYENGFYVGNESNPYVYFVGVKNKDVVRLTVAEGTRIIGSKAFKECKVLRQIILPNSVIRIEEQKERSFTYSMQMNLPNGYLKTVEQLPRATTLELLQTVWKGKGTVEDYVWTFLYQTATSLEKFSSAVISKEVNRAVDEMLCALEKYPRPSAYKKAVKFAYQNKEQISRDKLQDLYNGAQKAKVTCPEMDLLQKHLGNTENIDEEPAKTLCLERFNPEEINTVLRKGEINLAQTIKKNPVHYAKSKKVVSAFVIQCVVAKYVDIMQGDSPQPKQIKEIDEIVASFDKTEFDAFVRDAGVYAMKHGVDGGWISLVGAEPRLRTIGLIGRYGNGEMIGIISNAYDTMKADYFYQKERWAGDPLPKINKWKRYLKAALLMSDLPEACEYCINKGWTAEYAEIRGISPVEVEEMAGMQLTPDDRKVLEAVALYEKWVSELNDLMDADRTYNEPTVKEMPSMSPVSVKDPLVERFYAAIRDKYIDKGWIDLANDLYRWWTNAARIEDGHIGVEFTIGLLVASYVFISKDVSGCITYCRDKWEYRGDYSSATRLCLTVSEDASDWKAYMDTGYRVYDM